jgi:hypothetical protein
LADCITFTGAPHDGPYFCALQPTHGRDFEVLFRLYGPEKAFFEKTWKLPDIEEVK